MDVRITGRHAAYGDDVKEYVEDKLEPLSKFNQETRFIEVVLDEARNGHECEVIAHMRKGAPLVVHANHDDVMAAVDIAHDKLEAVLRKVKEKAVDRRHGRAHNAAPPQEASFAVDPDSEPGTGEVLGL